MATLAPTQLDKDKENQQVVSAQPPMIGAAPAQTSAPSTVKNVPNSASSGRFVGLGKYLEANKKTDIAGSIGEKIEGSAEGVRKGIEQSRQQFNQQAQGNRVQFNPNMASQVLSSPESQDQATIEQFRRQMGGQYAGPTELANAGELQSQLGAVQTQAQQTGTQEGRFALLKNLLGGKNYAQRRGLQTLDQTLLQGQGGGTALQNLGQRANLAAQQASGELGSTNAEIARLAQQYKQEAANTGEQARGAFGGAVEGLYQQAAQRAKDLENQQADLRNQYINQLRQGQVPSDVLGRIAPEQRGDLGEIDWGSLVSRAQGPTLAQAASQDQISRAQALQRLAGGIGLPGPAGSYLNELASAQGGFALNPNVFNVDYGALQNQLSQIEQRRQAAAEAEKDRLGA